MGMCSKIGKRIRKDRCGHRRGQAQKFYSSDISSYFKAISTLCWVMVRMAAVKFAVMLLKDDHLEIVGVIGRNMAVALAGC